MITQIRLKVLEGMVYHLSIDGIIVEVGRKIDDDVVEYRVKGGVFIIQNLQMTEGDYDLPLERTP